MTAPVDDGEPPRPLFTELDEVTRHANRAMPNHEDGTAVHPRFKHRIPCSRAEGFPGREGDCCPGPGPGNRWWRVLGEDGLHHCLGGQSANRDEHGLVGHSKTGSIGHGQRRIVFKVRSKGDATMRLSCGLGP